VDVYENWQLLEYAAGILYSLGISGLEDQYTDVYFHIIQPRSYHRDGPIRTFSAKASALRGYFNILEKAELEASQPIAPCNPSPQCEHCLGRHACISLQRAALSITDSSLLNTPLELPAPAVSKELQYLKRAAELIDARITGLEAQATSMIKRGEQLPAFRLEVFSGRDRWNVDAKEVITLGDLLGFDLRKPNDVVTPNQAAKLGIPDEIIKKYLAKNKTSLKLTLDENKSVRKIFSNGST
jgi:hypothetical protein